MKKSNFRALLLICAIIASLASYTFINTRQISIQPNSNVTSEISEEEKLDDIVLPEVQLVKKLLQKSREILPATRF